MIEVKLKRIHIGVSTLITDDFKIKNGYSGLLTITKRIGNFTGHDIWSINRDNLVTLHTTEENYPVEEHIVFSTRRTMNGKKIAGPNTPGTYVHSTSIRSNTRDTIMNRHNRVQFKDCSEFYNENAIPYDDIGKAGPNGLYIEELDLVVTNNKEYSTKILHPFTVTGATDAHLSVVDGFDPETEVNVRITLIDNDGLFGTRYVNINGITMVVHGKQSKGLEDGLYVAGLDGISIGNNNVNNNRDDICYTLKEIRAGDCPFELYNTIADAESAKISDPHTTKRYEREREARKHENDIDMIELNSKVNLLKSATTAKVAANADQLADIATKSNIQKGIIETLKIVTTVITVLTAIYAFTRK